MQTNFIMNGDCLQHLKELPENSIDAIITDAPYGLSFMNKHWDYEVPSVEIWKECLRVLKHGGHLLSFAGTRTYHRMAVNIEDAGFEIRDMISWIYGSGFPKSLNIGKAIDKIQGNERKPIGNYVAPDGNERHNNFEGKEYETEMITGFKLDRTLTKGNSIWEGWGTALKPAHEPIVLARKPLAEKTVAENVLKWGTGGINVDGSRIEYKSKDDMEIRENLERKKDGLIFNTGRYSQPREDGRFPANVILDEEAGILLDQQSGNILGSHNQKFEGEKKSVFNMSGNDIGFVNGFNDKGGASRFFYCAKASKSERNLGCEEFEEKIDCDRNPELNSADVPMNRSNNPKKNNHPTVKPIKLMEYLIKMVTPKGGIVLDPFLGSGTTAVACIRLGYNFIGIEKEEEYIKIAEARINHYAKDGLNEKGDKRQ